MASAPVIYYVDGDELPDLTVEFEGVDLSTWSSVELRIRLTDDTLVTSALVVDDGPNGLGHFEFTAGDIVTGRHHAEIRTVRTSARRMRPLSSIFS